MTSMYEEGDPNSKIIFLGQAPSYVEKRMQRPLVGPAGEVFNDCLHASGLIRAEAYILNVWPYEVTTNKITNIITHENGEVLWRPKMGLSAFGYQEAQPTLERIQRSTANLIVTLGAQAMELMVGRRPLTKWRGSILQGKHGKKVIPTFHPAATLHGVYLWRYTIINDFGKARAEKEYADLRLPKRNHIIAPRLREVLEYMAECRREASFSTDHEVINHQSACFSLCFQPFETMTVPFTKQDGSHYWTEDEEGQIWLAYAGLMEDEAIDKINQNLIGFDAPFLVQQNNIITAGFLGDNMIAQNIMYPEFLKGLDFITSIYTREPYYKDEGKMWKGIAGPIEQFWTYCGKDAAVSMEAWGQQSDEMTEKGFWPTYNMTAALYRPLTYMTVRGFAVDHAALALTKERVRQDIVKRYEELKAVSEWDFNPNSPKQCQQYFYVTKGIKPYIGATGNPTTDDKALARIFRRYNLREAKLVQEIRGLEKLMGTYMEVGFDADGRLRSSWNPRGTWTGRLSSSASVFGTGLNMQNLHPQYKNFLVADEEPI